METSLYDAKLSINRIVRGIVPIAIAIAFVFAAAPKASSETTLPFPRPAAIQPNVDFWVDVFTKYSDHDFVIMDRDNISRIYHVFHLPGDGQPTRTDIDWANAVPQDQIFRHSESPRDPADLPISRSARSPRCSRASR